MKHTLRSALQLLLSSAAAMLILAMSGCQTRDDPGGGKDIVTFQLSPSSDGVGEFMELLGEDQLEYNSGSCYNVTPQDITERYGFQVFKFDTSCGSFLEYEDGIYPLGVWLGGCGVTSFAVADMNEDGNAELFFTFSWGSGMHRSQAGYFDSAKKDVVIFDFINWGNDSVLKLDENQTLCLYQADCDYESFVDINMIPGDKLARITWTSDRISLTEE